MIIRKLFKVENSHIVRNCTSERCSKSIHGHSGRIELFFEAIGLDNGQMIVDFGLLKNEIKDFIDSFDHCHIIWSKEKEEDKKYLKKYSSRCIELPCSPSAEMLSLTMLYVIDHVIMNTKFNNGERLVKVVSVRYHETETGYAESFREDLRMWPWTLLDIQFSDAIINEWKNPFMWKDLIEGKKFINPIIEKQI